MFGTSSGEHALNVNVSVNLCVNVNVNVNVRATVSALVNVCRGFFKCGGFGTDSRRSAEIDVARARSGRRTVRLGLGTTPLVCGFVCAGE